MSPSPDPCTGEIRPVLTKVCDGSIKKGTKHNLLGFTEEPSWGQPISALKDNERFKTTNFQRQSKVNDSANSQRQ